jgi:lipoyl(octanoyl) transferase
MKAMVIRFRHPVPYSQASRLQDALGAARIAGDIPDTILLLEHPPVVTLGRRKRDNHLHIRPEVLAERGIEFAVSSRGGDVTYHGPGQIVLYPILQLSPRVSGSHGYLWQLEEVALRSARAFGVEAFRRPNLSGAWTTRGKLAAIGFRIKRWVTSHGMSFNVSPDLTGFSVMAPCGLAGEPVTSLNEMLGPDCPSLPDAVDVLAVEAARTFGIEPRSTWADAYEGPPRIGELLASHTSLPA